MSGLFSTPIQSEQKYLPAFSGAHPNFVCNEENIVLHTELAHTDSKVEFFGKGSTLLGG